MLVFAGDAVKAASVTLNFIGLICLNPVCLIQNLAAEMHNGEEAVGRGFNGEDKIDLQSN